MAPPLKRTDEEIFKVTRLLLQRERSSATMRAIAEMAKMSTPALFKRFGSRDALVFRALGVPEVPDWAPVLEAGPNDQPLEEQLRTICRSLATFFTRELPRWVLLRDQGLSIDRSLETPMAVNGLRRLVAWIDRGQKRGLVALCHSESVAMALTGALQSRALLVHLLGRDPLRTPVSSFADEVAVLFARALSPAKPRLRVARKSRNS